MITPVFAGTRFLFLSFLLSNSDLILLKLFFSWVLKQSKDESQFQKTFQSVISSQPQKPVEIKVVVNTNWDIDIGHNYLKGHCCEEWYCKVRCRIQAGLVEKNWNIFFCIIHNQSITKMQKNENLWDTKTSIEGFSALNSNSNLRFQATFNIPIS